MKKTSKPNTWLLSVALAVTAVIVMPVNSSAQEKGSAKGGAGQLMPKPIKTLEDISALQPGDMMVMSCPKCKNVTVNYVEPTFKAMETKDKVRTQHTCPSC